MKKFNIDISQKTNEAKQKTANIINKTKDSFIKLADQNGDGKLDREDVEKITGAIKKNIDEKKREYELKKFQPIFQTDIDDGDFTIQKFVRVADRDKKRAESEACKGAIGYFTENNDVRMLNIYRDSTELFGLTFYPDNRSEFYYVDPSDRDRYIALDDYFNYLKAERISELQRIAQDLGAKHFRVTFVEEKAAYTKAKTTADGKAAKFVGAEASVENSASEYLKMEIAAENDFPGKDPIKPKIKYLLRDPNIQNLITMRLNEDSSLTHQKLMIKLSNTSGLKETDAVKIDAVLRGMKFGGNTTVQNEAKNEARRYLEYEIDF